MTKALGGADEARMLSLAASAERTSSHPVASAIVGCAAARGVPVDLPVAACSSMPGTPSFPRPPLDVMLLYTCIFSYSSRGAHSLQIL
jgi:hypothetical protein